MTLSLILLVLILSLVQGAIVGLLPGVTGMVGLIILLPLFDQWPVEAILLFFSCYICVTQYFGSVSALMFKVPGEGSSIPVLEISLKLRRFVSIVKTYRATALTSLVGALVGIFLFTVLFLIFRTNWAYLFSTKFIVAFITAMIILLIIQNKNYVFNIAVLLAGLGLAYFNEIPALNSVCSTVDALCFLRAPNESTLVLLSLYCVPLLFYQTQSIVPKSIQNNTNGYLPSWRSISRLWPLGIKHGLLGFFAGFTPGAGLTMASNVSKGIEEQRNPHKLLSIAGAAEAANNAAAISCTIPFLFLGLPITPSELVVDNFLVNKFYRLNLSTLDTVLNISGYAVRFTVVLIISMLVINIISFLLCGHFIRFWRRFLGVDTKIYINIVKLIVLASITVIAMTSHVPLINVLFTLIVFGAIGLWAQRHDRNIIGLTMMLMMGPFIVTKYQLFYNLYF